MRRGFIMAQWWHKRRASERVPQNEGKDLHAKMRAGVTSDLILLPVHHGSPIRGHITKYEYTIKITQLVWTPMLYVLRPYYKPCPINIYGVSTPLPDPWKSELSKFAPPFWNAAQASDAQTKWRYDAKSYTDANARFRYYSTDTHFNKLQPTTYNLRHKSTPKENKLGKTAVKYMYFT